MIGERLKKRTFDMTKEDITTRAEITREEAKKNGKIFRCGRKNLEENRTAKLIKQAVLARKQNV